MKILNYRSKFIFYNILIYLVIMLVVLFVVLQSVWYFSVTNIRNNLLQTGTNINLYIQEKFAQLESDTEKLSFYYSNSNEILNSVMNYSNYQVQLLSEDGITLNTSLNSEPVYMNEEFEICKIRKEPVMSIRTNNGLREVWVMTPIVTQSNSVIGYAGIISPLTTADSLEWIIFDILGTSAILGLLIITFISFKVSNNFVKPIKELTKVSNEINNGQYDKIIHYKRDDEIGELTRVYNDMVQSINKVIIQLKSERKRLGDILASLDDGVIAVTEDGNVILTNKYIKTYFDVSDPKTIYDFTHQKVLLNIFEKLKAGRQNIIEEVEVNGRILLLTGSPIKSEGIDKNYLIIIRNITTERTHEKEQRKFISSVSHELRTPLTTIIGYTDMLSRRQVNDPKLLAKSLNTINSEGHRLVRLVDDLLNSNSVENMNFSVNKKLIDLNTVLQNVVDQMRIKSWTKEIEITYKAEDNLPEIYGDYDRLKQIFINIIHNAIKFSNVGGIIDVILTKEDDQYLNISIRDYGIGIDPVKKDLIFSAFYRVDEDRARNEGEGGAGLGLYLVKQVVDKHNGRIKVDSEIDEGTNITILLPIKNEDVDPVEII